MLLQFLCVLLCARDSAAPLCIFGYHLLPNVFQDAAKVIKNMIERYPDSNNFNVMALTKKI